MEQQNKQQRIIPFQIINNQSRCNNWNGSLPMMQYGLIDKRVQELKNEHNNIGWLSSTTPEKSSKYSILKPDMEYANFLMQTQQCNI